LIHGAGIHKWLRSKTNPFGLNVIPKRKLLYMSHLHPIWDRAKMGSFIQKGLFAPSKEVAEFNAKARRRKGAKKKAERCKIKDEVLPPRIFFPYFVLIFASLGLCALALKAYGLPDTKVESLAKRCEESVRARPSGPRAPLRLRPLAPNCVTINTIP
jgi:hypothetical protein